MGIKWDDAHVAQSRQEGSTDSFLSSSLSSLLHIVLHIRPQPVYSSNRIIQ